MYREMTIVKHGYDLIYGRTKCTREQILVWIEAEAVLKDRVKFVSIRTGIQNRARGKNGGDWSNG